MPRVAYIHVHLTVLAYLVNVFHETSQISDYDYLYYAFYRLYWSLSYHYQNRCR